MIGKLILEICLGNLATLRRASAADNKCRGGSHLTDENAESNTEDIETRKKKERNFFRLRIGVGEICRKESVS